jgi:CheY-like chemotaxis protein
VKERPILVVDDDPSIRAFVAELLTEEGYTVHTAADGADALRQLETLDPALVVLDMRMPVLDGWGVARGVASQGRRLPLLVMTAAQDARRWAAEVGAAGYIAKPFDLLTLLEAVERIYGQPA